MQHEIKRFNLWSVVKIVFIISLLVGFVFSLIYAGLLQMMTLLTSNFGGEDFVHMMPTGASMFFIVVVFFTIAFAVFYTIFAAFAVVLYNIIAGWAGGIVVELDQKNMSPQIETAPQDETTN
ncbi:DUF3566 domain-containing protein [candidate division KSB1 bacterium]|nr:DUF3566 domain-containing protein [candidate division KSB1 bacterium]